MQKIELFKLEGDFFTAALHTHCYNSGPDFPSSTTIRSHKVLFFHSEVRLVLEKEREVQEVNTAC